MDRYSRQILFPPIGRKGQQKIMNSRVAIVGLGALGSVLANHMVRAGVGFLRIIDRDFVEESNLQRQMLYDESDVRGLLPKAVAAFDKLSLINSQVEIDHVVADINNTNAEELLSGFNLVLDGTDNFLTRFIINDVCVKHGIPWIYGGAVSSNGMYSVIRPGETACFRCLFETPPETIVGETCDTAGVIGPLIHIVASFQAVEALKILTDNMEQLNPFTENFDIWFNEQRHLKFKNSKRPNCQACANHNFEFLDPSITHESITSLCGRNTIQFTPTVSKQIDLTELSRRISHLGIVNSNKFLVRLHINPYTLVYFSDGRVLIQGTDDISTARSLYSKYVGA
ncbi:ThiF family adenylyltransferase [Paenibacillus woosongensis]|uniref:Thiazole biosynthesis adenylyltransferase ThiF n=1 Tax=Paenibacillus woosongensis TaxID=307580 RepID=A0A7X2Z0C7_9BACL|nr:ThiF family adenylyltransferase [Paenibacillus woosongensis]MUG45301.1 thiazole biosynthesis adenylyltransferase ThiF [Paenibacillus woosongensis]